MLVSYKWLQEYFDEQLPEPKKLAEVLSLKTFEIEGVEEVETDAGVDCVIDVDVLPNRAHDCLSHLGIAREISTILNLPIDESNPVETDANFETNFSIDSKTDVCRRYVGCEVKNVKISESPDELKSKMQALGQKSINNLVDITNIVMFELGQPMHAFDSDKISGDKILIRKAEAGEKITTLDNKEVELKESDILIADSEGTLAMAGVKGGKKAEVDTETRNIFLESANFVPTNVRKTSRRTAIVTDSSKRFENNLTPVLAEKAMNRALELIMQYASTDKTEVSNKIDYYPKVWRNYRTGVSTSDVNRLLGIEISEKEVSSVLESLKFKYEIVNPREKIVEELQELLDRPYKYGASVFFDAPHAFDCSSLVSYVHSLVGYSIPRMAVDQFVFSDRVEESEIQPGDLVFANTGEEKRKIDFESVEFLKGTPVESGVDHVGIYIGDGKLIHCTELNNAGVIEEEIASADRFKNIIGYGRIIKEQSRFAVEAPSERLDIKTTPDLIEEIGRIYGYEKVENQPIEISDFKPNINPGYHLDIKISNILVELGFSEIISYSFVEKGSLRPTKPIADDKKYVREELKTGMEKAFALNLNNADLLGLDQIKLFEIGKVFKKVKKSEIDLSDSDTEFPETDFAIEERLILSIGVKNKHGMKKPAASESISESVSKLKSELGIDLDVQIDEQTEIVEIDLGKLILEVKIPGDYPELVESENGDSKFTPFSQYPFMLRDISVWLPNDVNSQEIIKIVRDAAGDLFVNHKLFDVYEKEGRTSYAYRLVFQSNEKTLTDREANEIMEKVNTVLAENNWEVR